MSNPRPQPAPPTPTLSVIIPARDAAATLGGCLRSLLDNSHPPQEIIVVDDGSVDTTAALVRDLQRSAPMAIHLLQRPVSGGPAAARNDGAAHASSDILLFVDADTEASPDLIDRLLHRFAVSDAAAVCGVYAAAALNSGAAPAYKALFDSYQFSKRGVTDYDGFSGYCGAVRAAVFAEVGGFDASLAHDREYENEEFGYRLSHAHQTLLDPDVRVRHHFPPFLKGTRNYFVRVSQWVQLFLQRGRFEKAGDATSGGAIATLSAAFVVVGLPVLVLIARLSPQLTTQLATQLGETASVTAQSPGWPQLCAAALMLLWVFCNAGLFRYILSTSPRFFPLSLLLNLYFGTVISVGAVAGLGMGLWQRLSGGDTSTT